MRHDPNPHLIDWKTAHAHCAQQVVGGVNGFHLPMVEQLASLLPLLAAELNSATDDGPFSGVQANLYWSTTTFAALPSGAWSVNFVNATVDGSRSKNDGSLRAWCARGGQVYDGQDVLNVTP